MSSSRKISMTAGVALVRTRERWPNGCWMNGRGRRRIMNLSWSNCATIWTCMRGKRAFSRLRQRFHRVKIGHCPHSLCRIADCHLAATGVLCVRSHRRVSAGVVLPVREDKAMTKPILSAPCLVIALSAFCAFWSGAAEGLARGDEPSLNDLSMEVAALQAFHQFQLSGAQLEILRKFAKETSQETIAREKAK